MFESISTVLIGIGLFGGLPDSPPDDSVKPAQSASASKEKRQAELKTTIAKRRAYRARLRAAAVRRAEPTGFLAAGSGAGAGNRGTDPFRFGSFADGPAVGQGGTFGNGFGGMPGSYSMNMGCGVSSPYAFSQLFSSALDRSSSFLSSIDSNPFL
jgi:hypothetical protein